MYVYVHTEVKDGIESNAYLGNAAKLYNRVFTKPETIILFQTINQIQLFIQNTISPKILRKTQTLGWMVKVGELPVTTAR